MPNTNDLQIEGDFWEAICILWDWAFESISVPQSKGIGQQHPPQVNLKWEKICTFLKEMQAKLPEMSKSTILWFIIFSQPGSGKWLKGEFFLQNIDFFYFHYFSILIPLCITTSPSPSLNTLPNIHVLWTDHVNLSSSHFNDRESYVSSCVLTSPIGG